MRIRVGAWALVIVIRSGRVNADTRRGQRPGLHIADVDALLHPEVTIVTPACAPTVLQQPKWSSILGSVSNHGNGVSSGGASGTTGVNRSVGERKGEEIVLH